MIKASAWMIAAAAGLGLATPALAYHHHRIHRHPTELGYGVPVRRGVMPDVLVADPYGDVIIDGKTGYHRSTFGTMVPDSEPASIIATGRASGSGLGANGLPGINWQ